MAAQRRDITPDVLAAPPVHPLLQDAPLRAAQPRARHSAVLPDLGRPGPADHVHRTKGGPWRQRCRRLPQLQNGAAAARKLPRELEGEDARATFEKRRQRESRREKSGKQKVAKGGRDWILRRKEVRHSPLPVLFLASFSTFYTAISETREGRCPRDSKYTGRKRRAAF